MSTDGTDLAQFSIFVYGPMFKRIQKELIRRGIIFHAVTGMKTGSLSEICERAYQFLDQHPVWSDRETPIHLLGHSAGGLIARLVANRGREGQILSCVTIATPNRGAALAEVVLGMPHNYPRTTKFMQQIGWDATKKLKVLAGITSAIVLPLFEKNPIPENVKQASIVCSLPRREFSLPMKVLYWLKPFAEFEVLSDGLVDRESQPFGDILAELKLDHCQQIGLFGKRRTFNRMCDILADYFKTF